MPCFYWERFGNPFQLPAITTMDADLLIPQKIKHHTDFYSLMETTGFVIDYDWMNSLMIFMHADFKFEFITVPGAKTVE